MQTLPAPSLARRRAWSDMTARILVATVGNYLFAYALAAWVARVLPIPKPEAGMAVALGSVFPLVAVAVWAFAARSIWPVAGLLLVAGAALWSVASGSGG